MFNKRSRCVQAVNESVWFEHLIFVWAHRTQLRQNAVNGSKSRLIKLTFTSCALSQCEKCRFKGKPLSVPGIQFSRTTIYTITKNTARHVLALTDLSTLAMVYESAGATLDCSDTVHCTDLCNIFVDQLIVFQFRKCLHILFHSS